MRVPETELTWIEFLLTLQSLPPSLYFSIRKKWEVGTHCGNCYLKAKYCCSTPLLKRIILILIDILIHISSYSSCWNSHSLQHCYKNHFLLKTLWRWSHWNWTRCQQGTDFFHVGSGISTPCSKTQARPPQGLWCIAGASKSSWLSRPNNQGISVRSGKWSKERQTDV